MDYTIYNYIEDPLDASALRALVEMVGGDPAAMVRGELDDPSVDGVVSHLVENPADMQRPIAVNNGKAVIGRPSELVLDVLD